MRWEVDREHRLAGSQIDHDLAVRSSTMMQRKLSAQAIADVLDGVERLERPA